MIKIIPTIMIVGMVLALTPAPDPVMCAEKTYFQEHVWADPSIQFCK